MTLLDRIGVRGGRSHSQLQVSSRGGSAHVGTHNRGASTLRAQNHVSASEHQACGWSRFRCVAASIEHS